MEKFQILVSVIFTLWKCEELTMLNVTFHNIKESWKDAAKFCLHKGGVLESNVTLLREQDEFKNATAYMWLGKYRTFTNWTYVRGCFLINGNFQHFEIELSNTAELQCQMLCDKYKFYSIKMHRRGMALNGKYSFLPTWILSVTNIQPRFASEKKLWIILLNGADCYCIEDIDSFARSANCNCVGCYKVWEHRLPDFGTAKKNEKCIAAIQCVSNKLKRRYVKCDTKYDVTCDNDAELGYTYDNYQAVAEECEGQGSFIKWYSDNVCAIQGFSEHWTSGTRQNKIFLLRKAYVTENLQPGKCFILKKDKDREEKENCKNKHLPFFCRFEKDEDKGDIISIPNLSMPQKNVQSDDLGSIAAGTVTSIIVVIVVISVLVFIHRRRLSKKTPTLHESQNNSRLQDTVGLPSNYETSKAPVYHEIDAENFGPHSGKLNCSRAVNNITYDQVNSYKIPKSQNVNQSTNSSILTNLNSLELQRNVDPDEYEMAKVINVTGNSSEGVHSSNYCLAKPITSNTEEESDPYDINRDYDHLNNVKKKEDPITKVYDHLPTTVTDDPTYDHSNLKSVLDNDGYYDHFTIDGADV